MLQKWSGLVWTWLLLISPERDQVENEVLLRYLFLELSILHFITKPCLTEETLKTPRYSIDIPLKPFSFWSYSTLRPSFPKRLLCRTKSQNVAFRGTTSLTYSSLGIVVIFRKYLCLLMLSITQQISSLTHYLESNLYRLSISKHLTISLYKLLYS